jgi:quercetin dioxygenase-like cupin family protein
VCSSNTVRAAFRNAHTHPDSAFIYATVLEGSILSQVNDGPVEEFKAGQSFSEYPGDRHGVSKNGSKTQSLQSS